MPAQKYSSKYIPVKLHGLTPMASSLAGFRNGAKPCTECHSSPLLRTGHSGTWVKTPQLLPYPANLLHRSPWNNFLRNNGYIGFAQNLKLKVLSDIAACCDFWQQYSSNASIFDLWEVRNAFFSGYRYEPYFLILLQESAKNQEVLGILPLWFNSNPTFGKGASDYQKYVWFGSNWPEDNVFFVKNPQIIPLLLTAAPVPLELACIKPLREYDFLQDFPGFAKEEDKKYFLDLTHISTLDDFLVRLKKKKRYNLRRDRKRVSALGPQIDINNMSQIEDMFRLSIERFRQKYPDDPNEHSAFEDERRRNVFRSLIANTGRYQVRIISTIINGQIEAVEFGLVYDKTYYAFNAGTHVSKYSGLGVFSNLLVIEDALKLGAQKIDFLESDNNWKDSWHFDYIYQYQFTK